MENHAISTTRNDLALLVLACLWLAEIAATACPACNIHNHLASSIACSKVVVVGKLVTKVDAARSSIEVIRSLRGAFRPGQVVELELNAQNTEPGETRIFSNAKGADLDFPVLDTRFEDEVRFLIRLCDLELTSRSAKDRAGMEGIPVFISDDTVAAYPVGSDDEAIQLTQGLSNQSKEAGMRHLQHSRTFPVQKIIAAIESLKPGFLADSPTASFDRIGNLLEALMIRDDPVADDYVLAQVRDYLRRSTGERLVSSVSKTPGADWLALMVGIPGSIWTHRPYVDYQAFRNPHPKLRGDIRMLMLAALPRSEGRLQAELAYALYDAGNCTSQQVIALLPKHQTQQAWARGIFWSARWRSHPWHGREAVKQPLADLQWMLTKPIPAELHSDISRQIGRDTERLRGGRN